MYKDFLVGKLFRIVPAKGKRTRDLVQADGINYVAAKKTNNGIADRYSYIDAKNKDIVSEGNCIVFVQLGDGSVGYTTYQPKDFVGMNGKIACGYIDGILNEKIGIYLMAALDRNKQLFSHSTSWTGDRLRNTVMSLPIKIDENDNPIIDSEYKYHDNGFIPDWDYMQEFIKRLEQEYVEELEQKRTEELKQYLAVTGLDNYGLTDEDKETLSFFNFGDYKAPDSEDILKACKEFKISDLFALQKVSNKLTKKDLSNEYDYPTYSSDTENSGIIGYTNNPEFVCNDKIPVYIIFGDHTRTLNIARKSFSVLDNVKVLIPCYDNDEVLLYLITIWQKQIPNLGYARHWKIAKNCVLSLPIQTDAGGNPIIDADRKYHPDGYIPDWEFIEKYIKAIEKLVIADVVKYKDEMIAKTKEVVSQKQ